MTTMIASGRDADGNSNRMYDTNTQETVSRLQPVILDEDFLGPGHSSIPAAGSPATAYPWVSKLVKTAGSPTCSVVANAAGGVVQLALDATNESQESTLYANDMLNWDATKALSWEARIAMSVLPTATVEAVFGMQTAWISGPDNATYYLRFQLLASGSLNMQVKDGVSTRSYPTGIVLVAGAFNIFRIDVHDVTNPIFSVNGVTVSTTDAMSFAASGSGAFLQPYHSVYKSGTTGVGSMQIDMVQASADRV